MWRATGQSCASIDTPYTQSHVDFEVSIFMIYAVYASGAKAGRGRTIKVLHHEGAHLRQRWNPSTSGQRKGTNIYCLCTVTYTQVSEKQQNGWRMRELRSSISLIAKSISDALVQRYGVYYGPNPNPPNRERVGSLHLPLVLTPVRASRIRVGMTQHRAPANTAYSSPRWILPPTRGEAFSASFGADLLTWCLLHRSEA